MFIFQKNIKKVIFAKLFLISIRKCLLLYAKRKFIIQ